MSSIFIYRWGVYALWFLLTLSIFFRPIIPIDETRYLSVAWEMWLRGDFLVPYLNGTPYSHKPPLLFWLFQAGWAVFGINEWWPKLVGPLASLANLLLVRKLAKTLWPQLPMAATLAPWILIATLLWTLFATSAMFDTLLTCFVLLGMLGMIEITANSRQRGWAYLTVAIGMGILAKGPVILLHLLPTALLIPLWAPPEQIKPRPSYKVWFCYLLSATVIGSMLALCWALPAALNGGDTYGQAILWHQTADRTVNTGIHRRSFSWYLLFILPFLLPWISWPRFWQNLRQAPIKSEYALRFCTIWLIVTFLCFSILPSKQVHYLIPMLPAFALLTARLFSQCIAPRGLHCELSPPGLIIFCGAVLIFLPHLAFLANLAWVQTVKPSWGLLVMSIGFCLAASVLYFNRLSIPALSSGLVASIFVGLTLFFQYNGPAYDLQPAADKINRFNRDGIDYAFVGDYQGQFQFLGRLTQPVAIVSQNQLDDWVHQHPDGIVISLEKQSNPDSYYQQRHREHWLIFRSAQQLLTAAP